MTVLAPDPAAKPAPPAPVAPDLADLVAKFAAYVARRLPQDALDRLAQLRAREAMPSLRAASSPIARATAPAEFPCCQDVGSLRFFVRVGDAFPMRESLPGILADVLRQVSPPEMPRPQGRDADAGNPGAGDPWLDWEVVPGDDTCTLEACREGGGASVPGDAQWLPAVASGAEVARSVLDDLARDGRQACPPRVLGVGVAPAASEAVVLSRRATLRRLGRVNPDADAARIEALIAEGLSDAVGSLDLPGSSALMGVHVERSARQGASIAVAVSSACWAHRRGTLRIGPDLAYRIPSHRITRL